MSVALVVVGGVLTVGVVVLLPTFKTVARVAPYAYPNARVRAMRSSLVSAEELEELAHRPYHDVVYALEQRSPALSAIAGSDVSFASLDSALRTDLVATLLKLRRVSPQHMRRFLSVLLSKYDIQVIQSVVRAQKARINVKYDILHATEVFSGQFITKKEISVDDLRNELKGTVYEEVFARHLDAIRAGEYAAFEESLDLLYFHRLSHSATSMAAKRYVKRLIDSHNATLALKGLDPCIPGGTVQREQLAGKSPSQVAAALRREGYHVDADSPAGIERDMQQELVRLGRTLMGEDPLSEASIIGFIILKTVTTRNTAILLKLKQHEVAPERILEVVAR